MLTGLAAAVGLGSDRDLLLGVKAVHKTQFLDVSNKYGPAWYPVGADQFAQALLPGPHRTVSTVRCAQVYLDVDYVGDAGYRDAFMERIFSRGSSWLGAVQFDMLPWHTDTHMGSFLAHIKRTYHVPVLLQCHGPAMEALGPRRVVKALEAFAGSVDFVLFDASHGTGTKLDVDRLSAFVEATYKSSVLSGMGVAVAGGLSAQVVTQDLPVLVDRFPGLSWDAEGSLHPVNGTGERPLDMGLVSAYLTASMRVLAGN